MDKKVSIIGIGMEGGKCLTRAAYDAIGNAEVIIGASRMVALAVEFTAGALTDALSFCTFTGGLTLTGTGTAAYTLLGAFCSEIRL